MGKAVCVPGHSWDYSPAFESDFLLLLCKWGLILCQASRMMTPEHRGDHVMSFERWQKNGEFIRRRCLSLPTLHVYVVIYPANVSYPGMWCQWLTKVESRGRRGRGERKKKIDMSLAMRSEGCGLVAQRRQPTVIGQAANQHAHLDHPQGTSWKIVCGPRLGRGLRVRSATSGDYSVFIGQERKNMIVNEAAFPTRVEPWFLGLIADVGPVWCSGPSKR
ncbi:hypothetical protein B0T22DRAFT_29415 [Podospora appendiculata]|uniref:Uncharacterized protein n=1 Tax=Podospora appendiculata TaxID=314037 RepID=A0AAE0XG96_9PEZI|nr:hypothetical protein B0T22DRAFT_29415 [Podospora appendiculata]